MTKRLIATIMTIIMVIGILPVTATAAYNRGGSWSGTLPELPVTEEIAAELPSGSEDIGEVSEPYLLPEDNGSDIDYALSYERLGGAGSFTAFETQTSVLDATAQFIAEQLLVSANYENATFNDIFGQTVVIDISGFNHVLIGDGATEKAFIENLIQLALAYDPYLYNTFNYSQFITTKSEKAYKYLVITPTQSCAVLTAARDQLKTKVTGILNTIGNDLPDATPAELALYIHDYIIQNTSGITSAGFYDNNAFGVLCNGKGTSKGYAAAYTLLLDKLGIPSIMVRSENLGLSWNQAQLDGQWYHVDTYTDDATPPSNTDKYIAYNNFLLNDSECVAIKNTYDITGAQVSASSAFSATPRKNNGSQIYNYDAHLWYYTSGYNVLSSEIDGTGSIVASPTTDFYDAICKDENGRYFVSAMGCIYYWDMESNTLNPYYCMSNPSNYQIKHMYFSGESVFFIFYNINQANYNSSSFTPGTPAADVFVTEENGTNVTLTCNATGNGFLSYKWQKAADEAESIWEDVSDEDGSTVTIFQEDIDTPYIFRCTVTNSCFKSVTTSSLTVDFADATSGFTNADYENALTTAKSYVSILNSSKYTASTYTALTDAIASAETCAESDAGTHVIELNNAVDALTVRSIPTPSIESCAITGTTMDYTIKMPWSTNEEKDGDYFTEYEHGFIYIRATRLTSGTFTVNSTGRSIMKLGSYNDRVNTNTSSCSVSSVNYYVRAYTRYYNENGTLSYTYSKLMLVKP